MKILAQFTLILLFTFLGEALAWLIPLPVPAAIYGLVLLLAALAAGVVKPSHLEDAADWLLAIMPLLFVAPAVNLVEYWPLLASQLLPIGAVILVSTLLVFGVSGRVTQALLKGKSGKEDEV